MEHISRPLVAQPTYDRMAELKAFDKTKAGVKGIVDAGITKIPRIFVRPEEDLARESLIPNGSHLFQIPIINLDGLDKKERRKEIVEEIRRASETWGFFQLLNHGIPVSTLEEMLTGARRFFDQDVEVKKQIFSRDRSQNVRYNSNFDLYSTVHANWRDTLYIRAASDHVEPEEIPETCREITLEYMKYGHSLAYTLLELLSEGLGLEPDHLKNTDCIKWCQHDSQYYPACPEPELTLGTTCHEDPSCLTVLLQGDIGGLQVRYQNYWIDVPPVPGALVVNIGDILQLLSNNKLKSSEHRVLASRKGPRMSVTLFCRPSETSTVVYGPIKELLSKDNPPKYKGMLMKEYMNFFDTKGLDGVRRPAYFEL